MYRQKKNIYIYIYILLKLWIECDQCLPIHEWTDSFNESFRNAQSYWFESVWQILYLMNSLNQSEHFWIKIWYSNWTWLNLNHTDLLQCIVKIQTSI